MPDWQTRQNRREVCFDPVRLQELGLVDWADRGQLTEEFRIIKRQLAQNVAEQRSGSELRQNLVMVTSAWPQEGRTFTALNLAMSIAVEPHRRALLVDACSNRSSLETSLTAAPEYGWLDVIADPERSLADVVLETDIPRLELLTSGPRQRDLVEPLASDEMHRLLLRLADSDPDRTVLIDAPPCLVSSDPAALASIVGETILVVEANRTQQQSVEAALELLRGCPHTFLVLNKAQLVVTDTSGFYTGD